MTAGEPEREPSSAARDALAESSAVSVPAWRDPDFRALFEQAPANFLVLAADAPRFTILAASDRYLATTLTSRSALVGRGLFEAFPDENPGTLEEAGASALRASLEKAILTRAMHRMPVHRYDLPGPDGRWLVRWWTLANAPVLGPDGAVRYLLHEVVDVTAHEVEREAEVSARHEAERLLRQSEASRAELDAARQRSEAVLASIADAFYLVDRSWRFTHVNDAAVPMLRASREALLGRSLWDVFPALVGSPFEDAYRGAMATGRPVSVEAYFPPFGTWFDARAYPWAGGLMVHLRDIGARKAAEVERERLIRALEVEEERAAFLATASAALAETLDPEAVLRTVARLAIGTPEAPGLADACTVTLAVPDDTRTGRWRTVIEGVDPAKVALEEERQRRFPAPSDGPRGYPAVIRTGRSELVTPEMMETQLGAVAKANPEHWAYFEALDLYSAVSAPLMTQGRILGALTLVRHGPVRRGALDTGDLALAEELGRRAAVALDNARLYAAAQQSRAEAEAARAEAEEALAAAEAANRAKSEFLAVMSHELRTPLNAIAGYTELLELGIHGPVTEEQRRALARIHNSERHLLGLINGVLNYARIEAGAVNFTLESISLGEVLASCEALVAPQLRARGLSLESAAVREGLCAHADRDKVQQIVLNLLSNAVKFTEPGGWIAIRCGRDEGGDQARVRIEVEDSGIGISPDQLTRVFEPFVQVDASLTRTREGTGLGLAISRDLARGMGGELTAESALGVGSTFTLVLPAG